MRDNRSDIHAGITIAIILSLSAMVIGIIAIANIIPRTEMSFDYLGLLVGIISLLVALLLGWQIVQTFLSREKLKNIDETIQNRTNHAIHLNLYHVFLFQGMTSMDKGDFSSALDYLFHSLDCANKCDLESEKAYTIIDKIQTILESQQTKLNINIKDCDKYRLILNVCNHFKKEEILETLKNVSSEIAVSRTTDWYKHNNSNSNPELPWL